jgi:hypothetical protein
MTRAPVIGSVQQGSQGVGAMLSQAGQGSLNRLTQAFQQQQNRDNAIVQAEAQRAAQRDMQANSIAAAHQQQIAGIDAQQENQRFLADEQMKRMVVGAGLEEEARVSAFENSLMVAREQAKQQAATFDRKFTTEQRVADARYARAEQMIEDSDFLDDRQKQIALQRLAQARATNSRPTETLGDPNAKTYPDGQGIGDYWVDESTGAIMSREPSGEVRMHTDYTKTRAGQAEKLKFDAQVKQQEVAVERENMIYEADLKKRESMALSVAKYQGTGIKGADGSVTYPSPESVGKYAETLMKYMGIQQEYAAPPEIEGSAQLIRNFKASGASFASLSRDEQRQLERAAAEVKQWRTSNAN